MLRTSISKAYLKRTIRPLYGWHQTTPKSQFLDPAWDRSVAIWPGMVMMKTAGENVTLIDGTSVTPYGLSALYIGGEGIDEVLDSGVNATAVWVLNPDAEFEILAPAFDSSRTYTEAAASADTLLYAYGSGPKRGQLTNVAAGAGDGAGSASAVTASFKPVVRLLKVVSSTKLIVGGLATGAR